jgi:6-pyruvoyltetrahydropterin/6-carboxytetrahydropterin synthase
MRQITATRRVQFCAGHRIPQHESKCRNLHGHNYVALLTAVGVDKNLDELGRVVDFSVLKDCLGGWVDQNWDHGFVLSVADMQGRAALEAFGPEQKLYLLDRIPTAENMARHLLDVVGPDVLRGTGVRLVKVVLWETENCYAEAE